MLSGARTQIVPVKLNGVVQSVTGKDASLPLSFNLYAAVPTPFNPSARIAYDVSEEAHVTLTIYNILGQRTALLID